MLPRVCIAIKMISLSLTLTCTDFVVVVVVVVLGKGTVASLYDMFWTYLLGLWVFLYEHILD
jgi:hypothetical protein